MDFENKLLITGSCNNAVSAARPQPYDSNNECRNERFTVNADMYSPLMCNFKLNMEQNFYYNK